MSVMSFFLFQVSFKCYKRMGVEDHGMLLWVKYQSAGELNVETSTDAQAATNFTQARVLFDDTNAMSVEWNLVSSVICAVAASLITLTWKVISFGMWDVQV